MINDEAKYKYLMTARETAEKYKYPSFLQRRLLLDTSTRWQRKLRGKIQVSKLAQRKLHSEICTSTQGNFFFFELE